MSIRNISWEVKPAGAPGWQSYHLHVPTVLKSGSFSLLEPSGPVQTCHGIGLPLPETLLHTHARARAHAQHWVTGDNGIASGFTCTACCSQRSKNPGEKMIRNSQLGVTRIIYVRKKNRRYYMNTNIQRNNYAYPYEKNVYRSFPVPEKQSLLATSKKNCWHSNYTNTAAVSDIWTGRPIKVTVIHSL